MALRITITTIILAISLFLTVAVLPDSMGIDEDTSMIIFMVVVAIVFKLSKNGTAVNGASLLLSIPIFMVLVMFIY
ncbi:hypothetical protein NQ129_12100 [Priestia aryabhattai]|uniref:hypothetical protein n=1 Tax=Priestia aryabhattai TaxID=412384 RepID=UPI00211C90DB|nr:hypothetical protein [Priestia aryabhattai]MCQ9282521.1 hypothetical protein [Priestia aryabhattai]